MTNDTSKYTVLFVDDEINILQSLKRVFRKESYKILTASSGKEGLEILEKNPVNLVISDNRMPEMTGVEFMAQVKERFPTIMRIALTGYTDVNSITAAINEGNIYKFILKPWEDDQLKDAVREALEVYSLRMKNIELTEKIKKQNKELLWLNENLETEVQKRIKETELQTHALKLSHEILEHLSVVVIGLDADKLIVFINKLARDMFEKEGRSLLGSQVKDFFDREIIELIDKTAETSLPQETKYVYEGNRSFLINCVPLDSKSGSRGMVLTFTEVK